MAPLQTGNSTSKVLRNPGIFFCDVWSSNVASLNDYHDEFVLPSDYEAWLPFTVDIYDGKVLVDGIDRGVRCRVLDFPDTP